MNPSAIARLLGAVALLLVIASIAGSLKVHLIGPEGLSGLVRLFNLDLEQNIPTLFSTSLLLFAALLLAVITALKRKQGASYVAHWAILSFGFLYLAADEASAIHEMLIRPVRWLLGGRNLGVFYHAWVVPAIAVLLVLALFFLGFLLHLPATTRRGFVVAAMLYVGGNVGVELVQGRHLELHGASDWTYIAMVILEESLEMAGIIVFIWALLVFIAANYKEVGFVFGRVREDNSEGIKPQR